MPTEEQIRAVCKLKPRDQKRLFHDALIEMIGEISAIELRMGMIEKWFLCIAKGRYDKRIFQEERKPRTK